MARRRPIEPAREFPELWRAIPDIPEDQDMAIEDYLRGAVPCEIPDNAVMRVLLKRRIPKGEGVSRLTPRQRDLATADIYMWCASMPSSVDSSKDTDGDWSHQGGGFSMSAADKKQLRKNAKVLYRKWHELDGSDNKVRIINL